MPDIIKLLPERVANQIAAGEVVQRPASVVKELLENSIDAGADQVTLIIRDGGKTLIQVTDNGKGMSETDARMCWERHATSKISKAEDLFSIRTFGFRGEAMASIAAVAQVELKTRRQEDELGTCIQVEGSEVKKQEPVQTARGTTITVKNLFFNIPARRNFLKSTPVETKHIIDEFQRVALAHPGISFLFLNQDNEVYNLRPSSRLQRIADIFGIKNLSGLLPAEEQSSLLNLSGYVGTPETARKTRGEQFFFVNNRYIRDAYLNHAVVNAYEGLIPKENYPLYVLFLDIDPARIDVNVHPGKTEIKFEDERPMYAILQSVVKKALGNYTITPDLDQSVEQTFNPLQGIEAARDRFPAEPQLKVNKGYDPFENQSRKKPVSGRWQDLFEPFRNNAEGSPQSQNLFSTPETGAHETARQPEQAFRPADEVFQLNREYVVAAVAESLLIIDQEAAHQRILYEKYLAQLNRQGGATQQLLFPRVTELQPADYELVLELMEELRRLGFDINEFGKNSIIINGVPPEASKAEAKAVLEGMIEQYKLNLSRLKLPRTENLARSMAQQSALKKGQELMRQEMLALYGDLMHCQIPGISPWGNPTYITFAGNDISALFKNR